MYTHSTHAQKSMNILVNSIIIHLESLMAGQLYSCLHPLPPETKYLQKWDKTNKNISTNVWILWSVCVWVSTDVWVIVDVWVSADVWVSVGVCECVCVWVCVSVCECVCVCEVSSGTNNCYLTHVSQTSSSRDFPHNSPYPHSWAISQVHTL